MTTEPGIITDITDITENPYPPYTCVRAPMSPNQQNGDIGDIGDMGIATARARGLAVPDKPHPEAVLILRGWACWWSVPDHCADYWGEDFRFPYGDARRLVA